MKKYIIIMCAMFLFTFVSAITVGTIYTQAQLDNADIKITTLDPSWDTKDNGNLRIGDCRTDADVCTAYVTIATTVTKHQDYDNETFEEVGEPYYEVVNKTIPILFRTTKYIEIRDVDGSQIAYDTLMSDLKPRAISKLKDEIARIDGWKTQDILDKQTGILEIVDGKTVDAVSE